MLKKINRIDLFMPTVSQYEVLHHLTRKLYEALTRQGVDCRLLVGDKKNLKPFLQKILLNPPDCTLTFNAIEPNEEGEFLCDKLEIPHVACLVDSPNNFFSMIKSSYRTLTNSTYSILTCPDRYSIDLFRSLNFEKVLFMPHGVEKELTGDVGSNRKYDVVMLSSCIDYEDIREQWIEKYSQKLSTAMDEAAEMTLSDQKTSHLLPFAQVMHLHAEDGTIDPRIVEYAEPLDQIEMYVRGRDRVELAKSVKDAKVDLFGTPSKTAGWDKYLRECPNVTIHGPVPFQKALDIMKQSKIVLNSCSWLKDGGHERIFSAMACGAMVITTKNAYMEENFTQGENIQFYQYKKWADVNDMANHYLANENERKILAKALDFFCLRQAIDNLLPDE